MLKMSSFCLHACPDPEALGLLSNSIVDNPLIHSRSHIPDFIPPTLWPHPNSPNLNMVDYKVWSVMREQVYHTPIHDVNDLKQRLLDILAALDQLFRKFIFWQIKFKHSYLCIY